MRRYEVTDEQWKLIEPLKPPAAATGRQRIPPRTALNGVLWVLRSGSPWRDPPERYGPWQSIYHHYNSWRRTKVFERILEALQMRLDRPRLTWGGRGREKGGSEEPRDHALGRSRGGFSSKLHLVSDGHGPPSRSTSRRGRSTKAPGSKRS